MFEMDYEAGCVSAFCQGVCVMYSCKESLCWAASSVREQVNWNMKHSFNQD